MFFFAIIFVVIFLREFHNYRLDSVRNNGVLFIRISLCGNLQRGFENDVMMDIVVNITFALDLFMMNSNAESSNDNYINENSYCYTCKKSNEYFSRKSYHMKLIRLFHRNEVLFTTMLIKHQFIHCESNESILHYNCCAFVFCDILETSQFCLWKKGKKIVHETHLKKYFNYN